jgi:hypothetical protein
MTRLGKTKTLNLRLSPEQRRRIERAAKLVSVEKGETVEPSTLFREFGMERVDSFLAQREPAVAA